MPRHVAPHSRPRRTEPRVSLTAAHLPQTPPRFAASLAVNIISPKPIIFLGKGGQFSLHDARNRDQGIRQGACVPLCPPFLTLCHSINLPRLMGSVCNGGDDEGPHEISSEILTKFESRRARRISRSLTCPTRRPRPTNTSSRSKPRRPTSSTSCRCRASTRTSRVRFSLSPRPPSHFSSSTFILSFPIFCGSGRGQDDCTRQERTRKAKER